MDICFDYKICEICLEAEKKHQEVRDRRVVSMQTFRDKLKIIEYSIAEHKRQGIKLL